MASGSSDSLHGNDQSAMPNPFASQYTMEQIQKAESFWLDVERHKPLWPIEEAANRPTANLQASALVREEQGADTDCGYYAVNTVLKNVGNGWSPEAQRDKLQAMQDRVNLLRIANSYKNQEQSLHKACRVQGLSYLVQRSELSQYDHSEALTFFAIDSLVPALELRLGEARVRMLAMNNNLSQEAVPLSELWCTLATNNEDDERIMSAYKANTTWVLCGNGMHWKTYFRVNASTFADLDSLRAKQPIKYLPVDELMQSVRAVAVIIPELPRVGRESVTCVEASKSVPSDSNTAESRPATATSTDALQATNGKPGSKSTGGLDVDFAKRVKAEYERLMAAAQEQGEVSSQLKKQIAQAAIANVKQAG